MNGNFGLLKKTKGLFGLRQSSEVRVLSSPPDCGAQGDPAGGMAGIRIRAANLTFSNFDQLSKKS
jgi:hypothetical protein